MQGGRARRIWALAKNRGSLSFCVLVVWEADTILQHFREFSLFNLKSYFLADLTATVRVLWSFEHQLLDVSSLAPIRHFQSELSATVCTPTTPFVFADCRGHCPLPLALRY